MLMAPKALDAIVWFRRIDLAKPIFDASLLGAIPPLHSVRYQVTIAIGIQTRSGKEKHC